jgi:hypothetical protein
MVRGQKALILGINRKLAPEGKAVVRTPGKATSVIGREYHLLDSQQGTKRYLSLNDVWHMARELGVLAFVSGLWETVGMAKAKKRIPQNGERVSVRGQIGAFVIYSVSHKHQVAELKQIGQELALSSIPWSALTFLDELDESQNALRVVRESTES